VLSLPFIFEQNIGKYRYVFEATSFRDENGKPRNRRTIIGKVDSETGQRKYNKEYLERMEAAGTPINIPSPPKTFSADDIRASSVKAHGAFYLYQKIAEKTGLLGILSEVFRENWQQIFDLACYLVSRGEPMMYCEDWLFETDAFPASLSSSNISKLLQSITRQEQEIFFKKWAAFRSEQEFLALDITSISSYSQLIEEVEWGYNRDGESLPQVNLCLLLGENSRLPVFQTIYNGSIKDVSTLKSTLSLASSIGYEKLTLVMDKGFSSINNINDMLAGPLKSNFIVALPFTLKFAKEQIQSQKELLDTFENTIVLGDNVLRGITKERSWYNKHTKHKVYAHVYCNTVKAAESRDNVYGHVMELVRLANEDPKNEDYSSEFKKYLIIRKSKKTESGYTINIRRNVVENALKNAGWLVLISNRVAGAREALAIYRAKDVVEKGFLRIKRELDLRRLRIHSDTAMQSKIFLGFIALILMAHLHNVMLSADLYKTFTMKELIRHLEKLKIQYISGNQILYPLTSTQKRIFKAFDIDIPT
jgi:transposase